VRADSGRLRQILSNLLSNATKFTEHGEVTADIGVLACGEHEVTLRVAVSDTGCGIPEDKLAAVFNEFDQGDVGTARRHGGTGLGLSIVRRLSELMGGGAGVTSRVGVGSTFWFTVRVEVPASQVADESDQDGDGLRERRVLVVDDNAANRAILLGHALGWGMSAEAAAGGTEALAKLALAAEAGRGYDIVLLDMRMPGFDGIEVAQRVRADPRFAALRIVMLTSMNRVAETERARDAGVDRYIIKPVRKAQLFSAMRITLGLEVETAGIDAAAGERPETLAGLKVLLVEDNPVNQEVANALLGRFGCRVTIAGGGEEGVTAAISAPFDVVLMDCQMPDIDGYEATRRIRAWELRRGAEGKPRIPIIALTANAMRGSREVCLEAGMDDFISKPFNRAALKEMLERWTVAASGRQSASADTVGVAPDVAAPVIDAPTAAINAAFLARMRELDPQGSAGLVRKVLQAYLDSSGSLQTQLAEALAAGNAEALWRSAHTLKSSSANVGAETLSALYKDLESCGRDGRLDSAPQIAARASGIYVQVVRELRSLLEAES
jgi:CheY-like chemotaxis protein/HPt (histidine-containing phosphotransfer) domain-containing protein